MSEYCECTDGLNKYGKISKKSDSLAMWIFTIIIVLGLVLAICNFKGYYGIGRYEGVILTALGIAGAIYTGVASNKKYYI